MEDGGIVESTNVDNSTTTLLSSDPHKDEQTCHMLPCSIDYQGMASSHVYFRPVEVDDGGVFSSTFRGRGLLALSSSTDSTHTSGALLSMQNQQLKVKAEIQNILEWQHEHNPETLFLETTNSRVQTANEWSEVALAVSHIFAEWYIALCFGGMT